MVIKTKAFAVFAGNFNSNFHDFQGPTPFYQHSSTTSYSNDDNATTETPVLSIWHYIKKNIMISSPMESPNTHSFCKHQDHSEIRCHPERG